MIKLPGTTQELSALFSKAEPASLSDFEGEYFVHMLTVLPSLRKLSHRKIFYTDKKTVRGRNVLFGNVSWGRFYLEEGVCEAPGSSRVVVINYDVPENYAFVRRIRDYVRKVDENTYLGRLNLVILGKPRFIGYFTLEKKITPNVPYYKQEV